jgi:hypothetical protein
MSPLPDHSIKAPAIETWREILRCDSGSGGALGGLALLTLSVRHDQNASKGKRRTLAGLTIRLAIPGQERIVATGGAELIERSL